MNLESAKLMHDRLEKDAVDRINESLESIREDLTRSNAEAAKRLHRLEAQPAPEEPSTPLVEPSVSPDTRRFVYFLAKKDAQWCPPLRQALSSFGDFVFQASDLIATQFKEDDVPSLDALPVRLVKPLCGTLQIPEETLYPFNVVRTLMVQADQGVGACVVFSRLWFLVRSNVVVCDLLQPPDLASAQILLFARQLGIPTIGVMPTYEQLEAWTHWSFTSLFTRPDISHLVSIVRHI